MVHRGLKRNLVIGLAALALAAFAGGAYAATQNSGPSTRQAFLNDVAKRLHVTPQQLSAALSGATFDQIQAAVQAGRLTQAQANALEQRLKNGPAGPGFGVPIGPLGAFGPAGPGMPKLNAVPARPGAPRPNAVPAPGAGFGPGFGGGFGALPAAASYLGLTTPQLFQQLSGGKSLAQIATSKGKTVSGLEQAMTAAERKQLDRLVTNKVITKAQENQILSKWSASLSRRVNSKGLGFPGAKGVPFFRGVPGRGYWPGRGYGPAFRVPAPGATPQVPGKVPAPGGTPRAPGKQSAPQKQPATPASPAAMLFQPAPTA